VDAFDSDVLIYAATPGHPLGRRVAVLFPPDPVGEMRSPVGIGSTLLLPEVLSWPMREGVSDALLALYDLLARLELYPLDRVTAQLAAGLGASYRLRAADAAHLATALAVGADRFLTNNRKDFRNTVPGIEIVYPDDLPDPLLS
jgi:hypothetical protein